MGSKIQWKGIEKLTVSISRADSKARKQTIQVVKNNTEKLKASAQAKAPVDTGFLKGEITASYPAEMEGHVTSGAGYGGYQEFGTRFQPGTPHIRPALQEIEPKFKADMTDALKGVFE